MNKKRKKVSREAVNEKRKVSKLLKHLSNVFEKEYKKH
jgi:hypothetical protein